MLIKESVNESDNESIKENNESDSNNKNVNGNENENDNKKCCEIKQLNDWFKTIEQTKSLEEQIEILKTKYFLDEYWHVGYYHADKGLNYKIFKAKAAHILNDLDEQLFEKKFGYTFAASVDKLIKTTSKEKNQIIIEDIENNKNKIFEQDKYSKLVIKPAYKRGDLKNAIKLF